MSATLTKKPVRKNRLAPDWRAKAAAATTSTEDVEKAFLDQAYVTLQNKATPIMKAPYKVGFEIVYANDERTRLVGIFVFRVDKELFYAPVFFINGSIKGTDLFYRHTAKKFVPLTDKWVEYLMGMCQGAEGQGVPMQERQNVRQQMDLSQIVGPPVGAFMLPSASKFASAGPQLDYFVGSSPERSAATATLLNSWLEAFKSESKSAAVEPSLLKKFIIEDGGFNAIRKLANTCQHDKKFARALLAGSKPENYMPQLDVYDKVASETEGKPLLTLYWNLLENKLVKTATADDIKRGFKIDDLRQGGQVNDIIYVAAERNLTSVTSPGIYSVLMADGATHDMICANEWELSPGGGYGICSPPKACCGVNTGPNSQLVLVDTVDNQSETANLQFRPVLGQFVKDLPEDFGSAKPSAGKAYRLYNTKKKSLSHPFLVKSVTNKDSGLTEVTLDEPGSPRKFWCNPDYADWDETEHIYGLPCRFVEVKFEKSESKDNCPAYCSFPGSIAYGDHQSLDAFIFENGYKKATVVSRPQDRYLVRNHITDEYHDEMDSNHALVYLMGVCAVKQADAEDALKQARESDRQSYSFFYKPAEGVKVALNLRAPPMPQFLNYSNTEFNVPEQPSMRYIMRAERDVPFQQRHRIGDMMNPDPSEAIDSATPDQLYGMSKARGVNSLFEHGVVGALTNTYDAISMVEKYLPDLETALDKLGRMIFLFYWKPEDFSEAYGSDDQGQLENKLVSNFKSFGDLVLDLLQKAHNGSSGSTSLT